jgi:ABC-type sugar transport system substrate-binding protein
MNRPRARAGFAASAAVIALVSSGCGSSTNASNKTATGATKQKPTVHIALITGHADGYYQAIVCGAKEEAKQVDATVSAQGPQQLTASAQIPLIDAAVANKPAALIIVPDDVNALNPTLQHVANSGIKIVTVDNMIAPAAAKKIVVSQVDSDQAVGGRMAADLLGKTMGGKGTALIMNVAPGIASAQTREQGFREEMGAKYPGIKLLPTLYDNNEPSTASSLLTSALVSNKAITGVYGINDNSVLGIVNALKTAGTSGKVHVVGWDGLSEEIASLKAGDIAGLVISNPEHEGSLAVAQAVNAVRGQAVKANVLSPLTLVTSATVGSASAQAAIKSYSYSASSCSGS